MSSFPVSGLMMMSKDLVVGSIESECRSRVGGGLSREGCNFNRLMASLPPSLSVRLVLLPGYYTFPWSSSSSRSIHKLKLTIGRGEGQHLVVMMLAKGRTMGVV